ncbi:MAG TPA: metal-dependent hydrolase [Panacibacter sp.]|nr:metal-dependent hydrolase [Panacibacter sp.]
MKLTYYGHACFSVETGGSKILFDPFISGNPLAKHIDINSIEADYIFISHGHGDHIADLVTIAKRTGATCVAAYEIVNWLEKQGIEKAHGMNYGGPIRFDFGTARGVNAIHSSSFPDGSYAGNPMGFVFTTAEGNFYYSGDTALTMDMQLIPLWAKLDFAVLPIGGNFTMNAADAVIAAGFIQCKKIIGVHYNTFGIINIDTDKATEDFAAEGNTLLLPAIGETLNV